MQKRILLLFHENSTRLSIRSTVVVDLARYWREMGYQVIYQFGVKDTVSADLAFVHVDLSVVPEQYIEYAQQFPLSINAGIKDIRKRAFSKILLTQSDSYQGEVVVKSNLNFGGLPEYLHDYEKNAFRNAFTRRFIFTLHKRLSVPFTGNLAPWNAYEVYPSLESVPKKYFSNTDKVVEQFLPEREGDLYALRMFLFFGNKYTCRRVLSNAPIVKAEPTNRVESVEPHREVFEWKKQFNIDYGKFDYVVHDGQPVLLDVNKTTGLGGRYISKEQRRKGHLERATAIDAFFNMQN